MRAYRITVILISLLVASQATAKSAVWEVSKGGEKLFLAGSVHLMRDADYPLPAEFDRAWQRAGIAVFETGMNAAAEPQFQQQMMMVFANPPGVTAESLLNPALWEKLVEKATELQLPIEQLQVFHPSFITLMLTIAELTENGISPDNGVDAYYFKQAAADGKSLQLLETPAEQLSYLASIKAVDANQSTAVAIRDIERLEDMMPELMGYWRSGDMQGLHELVAESMNQFPEVYETLIVARNRRWVDALVAMLEDQPVEFVLVGAIHLAGPDSVLNMLEGKGYSITQPSAD